MNLYINQIEEKIKNKIQFEEIKITDNTNAHRNHKNFQEGKFHLILEIKSKYLNQFKRLDAEKILMGIVKEDFEKNLHALEIKLK